MRPTTIRFVPVALLLSAGCLPTQSAVPPDFPPGETVRLTVLHTSDMHSRVTPYDFAPLKTDTDLGLAPEAPPYGGFARMAALIRRERARADRTLLLDSGDYWDGGPIFNGMDGEPEVRWMSMLNYDAVVVGNHEFDKGAQNFADKISRFGKYPLLAANYWWENRDLPTAHGLDKVTAPYTLTNVRGVRIAILGMASVSSMYGLVDGGNSVQATPLEQNEAVRAYVELLQPTTDLIIILSHLGLNEDQDLVTGYEAYYPYKNAKHFLTRGACKGDGDCRSGTCEANGYCKDSGLTRWVQIEPDPNLCAAKGTPADLCTNLDGTVRVFIPGVTGIDLIQGGHLHIVLNPPQVLRDPLNRPVILSHSGAFAKYLGRLELGLQFPPARPESVPEDSAEMQAWRNRVIQGAEVVAHDYHAFPLDAIWCDEEARSWRSSVQFDAFRQLISSRPLQTRQDRSCRDALWANMEGQPEETKRDCIDKFDRDFRGYGCDRFLPPDCLARTERCSLQEDAETTDLLQPYITGLDLRYALTRIFAFAPRDIARRANSTGGDSPMGNMTAESMRVRKRVEAEFALTNTLGIRDNLYAGPINLESMFNVFPFENTINIQYLSGAEVQEMADYVGLRSSDRGCQSQAQVSGMTFIMDCAQAQLNLRRYACDTTADCQNHPDLPVPQHPDGWRCTEEKVCWAHEAYDIKINGKPVEKNGSYKIAVNDYIARGGSGFKVLKRNTTRIETGISLRDSLIDYMRSQCTCADILGLPGNANEGLEDLRKASAAGYACARSFDNGQRIIDPQVVSWCKQATSFEALYQAWAKDPSTRVPGVNPEMCDCADLLAGNEQRCGPITDDLRNYCSLTAGKCTCAQVVVGNTRACGHISRDLKNFCSAPTRVAIAVGEEDGRIGRRVK